MNSNLQFEDQCYKTDMVIKLGQSFTIFMTIFKIMLTERSEHSLATVSTVTKLVSKRKALSCQITCQAQPFILVQLPTLAIYCYERQTYDKITLQLTVPRHSA